MNEADTFIESLESQEQSAELAPKKRERKAKQAEQVAELVSTKVKLKLLRAAFLDDKIIEPGAIVEVDEQTAAELLRKFEVQHQFTGQRYGVQQKEYVVRAERLN